MCERLVAASEHDFSALITEVYRLSVHFNRKPFIEFDARNRTSTVVSYTSYDRQSTWQMCTELGLFPTPAQESPMRSAKLDSDYWVDYCHRVFGERLTPSTEETNQKYGGLQVKGRNIIFTNGSEDYLQWASLPKVNDPEMTTRGVQAIYLHCDTCGFSADFNPNSKNQVVKAAQLKIAIKIKHWLDRSRESPPLRNFDTVIFLVAKNSTLESLVNAANNANKSISHGN